MLIKINKFPRDKKVNRRVIKFPQKC